MWLPHRPPVYYQEEPVQALMEQFNCSAQQGQGVAVAPPPPPPPPHNTLSSSTGPVCAPGWAPPSAVPAPSPNVEHSQHGGTVSSVIHHAENQLQEQRLKEQFAVHWNRQGYSDAQIQEWHAMSPEQRAQSHQHAYAAFCLQKANRRWEQANQFLKICRMSLRSYDCLKQFFMVLKALSHMNLRNLYVVSSVFSTVA